MSETCVRCRRFGATEAPLEGLFQRRRTGGVSPCKADDQNADLQTWVSRASDFGPVSVDRWITVPQNRCCANGQELQIELVACRLPNTFHWPTMVHFAQFCHGAASRHRPSFFTIPP